jgi:2-polyprenyl-6-methoxyphenol hydroxylase-like FAD-dependent oxidoreductase
MDAQLVIGGGGPAGALLAYLLSSRGIDTLLLQRHADFSREFRGKRPMTSYALISRATAIRSAVPSC